MQSVGEDPVIPPPQDLRVTSGDYDGGGGSRTEIYYVLRINNQWSRFMDNHRRRFQRSSPGNGGHLRKQS